MAQPAFFVRRARGEPDFCLPRFFAGTGLRSRTGNGMGKGQWQVRTAGGRKGRQRHREGRSGIPDTEEACPEASFWVRRAWRVGADSGRRGRLSGRKGPTPVLAGRFAAPGRWAFRSGWLSGRVFHPGRGGPFCGAGAALPGPLIPSFSAVLRFASSPLFRARECLCRRPGGPAPGACPDRPSARCGCFR